MKTRARPSTEHYDDFIDAADSCVVAVTSSIESRVITVISRQLRVGEKAVTPDASIGRDLGADSLAAVELIMAFEDEFGLRITDEDAEEITTVRQAIDYIARVINSQ